MNLHLQRVVPNVAEAFAPIEAALLEHFLPALMGAPLDTVATLRELATFPIKLAGLGITDPCSEADRHHAASVDPTQLLSVSLKEALPLYAQAFSDQAAGVLRHCRAEHFRALSAALIPILDAPTPAASRRMKQSKTMGAWLTAIPHVLNRTVLSTEEFQNNLRIQFGLPLLHLPNRCDRELISYLYFREQLTTAQSCGCVWLPSRSCGIPRRGHDKV